MHIQPSDLAHLLFKYLRQMDEEATSRSLYEGIWYPTGLREYAAHLCPNLDPTSNKTFRWEDAITNRLNDLLVASSLCADTFRLYPSGERGDLLVHLSDREQLWIEVKCAWRHCLHPRICSNGNYKKHLISSLKESCSKDFLKLQNAPASHVGVLLIGFDAPGHNLRITDADLIEMKQRAQFDLFNWASHYDSWEDKYTAGAAVRVWFWHRPQIKAM